MSTAASVSRMNTFYNLVPLAVIVMTAVAAVNGIWDIVKGVRAKRAARAILLKTDDPFLKAMIAVRKGRGLSEVEYATTRERVFELLAGTLPARHLAVINDGLFQNRNNARNDFLWDIVGR